MMPCHHTFCLSCVLNFYWCEEEERRRLTPEEVTNIVYVITVVCPTCSNSFVSTLEGLQELVADHRIYQLLDFVGSTDKHSIEYCPKHLSQPVNFFCERCVCRICRDCIVIDHKQCSNDKLVLDFQAALQKYTPAISNGVKVMEDEAKSLKEKKGECKSAKENFKRGDETVVDAIRESFVRLKKALEEREEKLIEMARKEVGVKEFDFEKKVKVYEEKESTVQELQQLIANGMKSDDIKDKYKAFSQLNKYTTEPALQAEEYENKNEKNVSFNFKDEVILTTKISNFGEIESKSKSTTSSYGRSGSIENSGSSSYVSSVGSYGSGTGRTSSYGGSTYGAGSSSLYSGSSYTSRYTPTRSYKY